MTTYAQVNFQKGETWLNGADIARVSFSDDGKIYFIYKNNRGIGYYDIYGDSSDITASFNILGITYFIDLIIDGTKVYVAGNDGLLATYWESDASLLESFQAIGIDSINTLTFSKAFEYFIKEEGRYLKSYLAVGTDEGLYFTDRELKEFYKLRRPVGGLHTYEGSAFIYNNGDFNVYSGYDYICKSEVVTSIYRSSNVHITTYGDSLSTNDFYSLSDPAFISYVPNLYIATDNGLYWRNWDCTSTYEKYLISDLKINDLEIFNPYSLLEPFYPREFYYFAGTNGGFYFSQKYGVNSEYQVLQNTEGMNVKDITVNLCAGEIYLATNTGIVQIKSFENKSFIPYVADLISPVGTLDICRGDTIKIKSGLNKNFDIQWFMNNDSIFGETSLEYLATNPGVYKFALYNCFFEELQYSNELNIELYDEVLYNWDNPDTLIVCESREILSVETEVPNKVVWYKDGNIISQDTCEIVITESGVYYAEIFNCNSIISKSNLTNVNFRNIEKPELEYGDSILCKNETTFLTVSNYSKGSIQWFLDEKPIDSLNDRKTIAIETKGEYYVRIFNLSCEQYSDVISIEKRTDPTFELIGNTFFCEGSNTQVYVETAPENDIYINDESINQKLTISEVSDIAIRIEDGYGCYKEDTVSISEQGLPYIPLPDDIVFCFGELLPIPILISNESVEYFINNNPAESLNAVDKPGEYEVVVMDSVGCSSLKTIRVVDSCPPIEIPNVFTPNGDGINEYFEIKNLIPNCKLDIYTRSGRLIHHSDNYNNDWDGGHNPDGMYYYSLQNRFYAQAFKGYLLIVK